jgi:hypothetical protein
MGTECTVNENPKLVTLSLDHFAQLSPAGPLGTECRVNENPKLVTLSPRPLRATEEPRVR